MITKDDILITSTVTNDLLDTDRIEVKATLHLNSWASLSQEVPREIIDLTQEELKSNIMKVLYKEKDEEIASLKRQLRHSGICVFD